MKLSPALHYQDANAAIDFLCRAFGFEIVAVYPGEAEGNVAHAELRLGDDILMLGSAGNYPAGHSPREFGGSTATICIYIEDAAAAHARAKAAGAPNLSALETKDYGGAGFSCQDPEGYEWAIGSYKPGVPPEPAPATTAAHS
jgi:uncharacterized glyoxalase superfamily protein PhnB